MLSLPILNVHLLACPADWQQMTPTEQGRHCASCNREVVDFTSSNQADLDAARAASPDGRLCGRFRAGQLAEPPLVRLRPKLRRFLVALVLVCGLGLSGREALAQVQQAARFAPTSTVQPQTSQEPDPLTPTRDFQLAQVSVGEYVEVPPSFKGGWDGLRIYVRQNLHYPAGVTARGKVFVSFLVTETGAITEAQVIKGLDPAFDAEALRLVQQMPAWQPAQQGNQPVAMRFTLPFAFGEPSLTDKELRRRARAQRRMQ